MTPDERLMCHALSLEYDFIGQVGRLNIQAHNCTDMTGCVQLFEAIDPGAKGVVVVAGDLADVIYKRGQDGGWRAYQPPKGAVL